MRVSRCERGVAATLLAAVAVVSCSQPAIESAGESRRLTGQTDPTGPVFEPGEGTSTPGTTSTTSLAPSTTGAATTTTTTTTTSSTTTTTIAPLVGWDAVSAYLRTTILDGGSDALSVAVRGEGLLRHASAFGVRTLDGDHEVTVEHRFRIASISKTITAITVLQMVEDGIVALDEPFLPAVAAAVGVDDAPSQMLGITLRQLLSHRSGLPQYERLFFGNEVDSCASAARVGLRGALQSVPGTDFQYSNLNFCLIGLGIEALTGRAYVDVVTSRLLAPLGIQGMRLAGTFDVGDGDVEHRSEAGRNYMETLGAAGSWIGRPADVVAILDSIDPATPGWSPLAPATIEMMRSITVDPPPSSANGGDGAAATSTVPPAPPTSGYGMGVMIFGPGEFGHTGTVESTHAMAKRRADGLTWVIAVSGDYPASTPALDDIMHNALLLGGFIEGSFREVPPPRDR